MQMQGIVIKGIGGFYYVEAAEQIYECKAKGAFRKDKITPVAGDMVEISVNESGYSSIDRILERKNVLNRPPVANLDKLFIVASTCEPSPNALIIDRLCVIACHNGIEPIVVFTKTDLKSCEDFSEIYHLAGIKCFTFSPEDCSCLDLIKAEINGCTSAFTGNTGVGKSTLLNYLDPTRQRETGEISSKLGRGRHTTRHVELYKFKEGYVADTPGFSSLDFDSGEIILKDDLQYCFPEFQQYLGGCKFTSCSHTADKGCAVVKAVAEGKISKSRHADYVTLYNEVKDIKEWQL